MSTEPQVSNDVVLEMAQAGVLFGHKKSKTHPRMKPYIGGTKNEIEILDPEPVLAGLETAANFLAEKVRSGSLILLVGTGAAAKGPLEHFAKEFSFPCVTNRWLGGTLTNFKVISDRMKYFQDLKYKKEKGELAKYTKRERQEFDKEIGKMEQTFSGFISLTKIPDVLLVIDPAAHAIAVSEAKQCGVPVVAVMDTNDDPASVDYPIFANDHARASIDWVVGKIREAIRKA